MQKRDTLKEQIRDLIYKKGKEYEDIFKNKCKSGERMSPSEERRHKIFQNLALNRLSLSVSDLPTARTQESGLTRIVDNSVMLDPVGNLLYQFSEENKKPEYVSSKWFLDAARNQWDAIGKEGREKFRSGWIMVSDARTQKILREFSEEELFNFYRDVEVIYNEKCKASYALSSMHSRKMKEEEYLGWAKKFGINLEGKVKK